MSLLILFNGGSVGSVTGTGAIVITAPTIDGSGTVPSGERHPPAGAALATMAAGQRLAHVAARGGIIIAAPSTDGTGYVWTEDDLLALLIPELYE